MVEIESLSPDVIIRYALLQEQSAALLLARKLLPRRWREAAPEFAQLIRYVSRSDEYQVVRFHRELLAELSAAGLNEGGELRDDAAEVVDALSASAGLDVRADLLTWFLRVAHAGQTGLAIRLFTQGIEPQENAAVVSINPWVHPLAPWLIEHGAAELRTGAGLTPLVLLHLIDVVHNSCPERLPAALQILQSSKKPEALLLVDGAGDRIIWPAVESALQRGLPEEWVGEFISGAAGAVHALGRERFFAALDPAAGLPLFRRALLLALAHGVWRTLSVWQFVLRQPAPESLEFNEDGLEAALVALFWAQREADLRVEWVGVLASAWFAIFGLKKPTKMMAPGAFPLDVLGAEQELAPGILRSLERELARNLYRRDLDDARELVAMAATQPRLVSAALLALPSASPDSPPAHGLTLFDVQAFLSKLIHSASQAAGLGAHLFGKVQQLELVDNLDPQVVIDFSSGVLRASGKPFQDLLRKIPTRDRALPSCALYLVHETVHVAQGIQRKEWVTNLRNNASERSLGLLDLEADHAAAEIVANAQSRSLQWLKDLQGKLMLAFPAGPWHTHASIERKSVRFVGLRLDFLLRELQKAPVDPGFASIDLPSGNGSALFVWNGGPTTRVFGRAALTARDATALATAAGLRAMPVPDLDLLLRALIERMELSSDLHR